MNTNYLIEACKNCGYITHSCCLNDLNTSSKLLKKMLDNNIIKSDYIVLFGKSEKVYTLTDKYIDALRKKNVYIYKSSFRQAEHDYVLLKTYLSLPNQIKNTWKNETDLKIMYPDIKTTTDAMFNINNIYYTVEVITNSYSKSVVEEKYEFANNYSDKQIFLNVNDIKY